MLLLNILKAPIHWLIPSGMCQLFSCTVSYLFCRFAKIRYFFEEEGEIMVHAQWFQHGAQIILQELAHPQGLFLIDECEDQPISSIYQKANVQALQSNEEEPINTPSHSNNFFMGCLSYFHKNIVC